MLPVILSLLMPVPLAAADPSAPTRAFAEAMARMMDAMGLLGDEGAAAPMPMPMTPPPMPGADGAMPGMDDMADWVRELPGSVELPGMPGWKRTGLDGIWEGRAGGLLIVQAHRFRLYSGQGGYIDGLIQQRGDRIAIYDPARDIVRPYEFAQHQGRLVLRDAAGQVYLYRRLWLDDDLPDLPAGGK
jgi:hypothetical protein